MSTDTETRILDAAERLFAAHGYGATSVRAITRAAGVNVASVHYHFGSKEAVLQSVLDRVAGPITQRRMELLSGLADATVEELIEAFVRPDFEALQELQARHRDAARFIGRIYSDPAPEVASIAIAQFRPSSEVFVDLLQGTMPGVPEAEIWWRLRQAVAVIVNTFAMYPEEGLSTEEMEHTIARLVAFLAPAMRSPGTKGALHEQQS